MKVTFKYDKCFKLDGTRCEDVVYENVADVEKGNGFATLVFADGQRLTMGGRYLEMHPMIVSR